MILQIRAINKTIFSLIFSLFLLANILSVEVCWGLSAKQIAQKSFPSVLVLVLQGKDEQYSMGSGFFVQKDIVATNFHVIKGAKKGYAKVIGKMEQYEILGVVGIDEKKYYSKKVLPLDLEISSCYN